MKQTVTSKYEPKSKNVTWIDMSSGSPVLKNYINGRWMPTGGSGGGAGSSNPTEADVTKVWQVTPVQKGTKTEETVIVPEQTLENEQELPYNDKFVPGAQCVAVINGVEYRGEVYEYERDSVVYYVFVCGEASGFVYDSVNDIFKFETTKSSEVTVKLSVIEEVPDYDYNWAPGVKIPIPTAEDEGKILVVTKVEGDNTSIIVPEQPVPVDNNTPLTDVDLTKFVVGNTVKVTISANSETITETGVLEQQLGTTGVLFYIQEFDDYFSITKIENSLMTNAFRLGLTNSTIKLEYIESNYEYQLQENSGGSSNILHCEGSDDTHGTITAYIDSSELDNPQITTIAVDTGEGTAYFYRMSGNNWLVSGFNTFESRAYWIAQWNTEGQYPTILAYYTSR